MPRHVRIDIAGQFYHVIARGNERKNIFNAKEDCEDFLSRLRVNLKKTGNKCLAWCLMPNHFHLLILRGESPLAELMRRLMTGYAVGFNIRHRRVGHLFQNRYKALLCEEEKYFRELVAYIHLNPLRAGLVNDMVALKKYPWCGHAGLLGKLDGWVMERDYVLSHFEGEASVYTSFLEERKDKYVRGEYSGGGLMRSLGGLANVLGLGQHRAVCDERILGSGDFIEEILKKAGEEAAVKKTAEEILGEAANLAGISQEELLRPGHGHKASQGRALYCYMAKEKAGLEGSVLCGQLKLTRSGISRLVEKGRKMLCPRENS